MDKKDIHKKADQVNEDASSYGFTHKSETERLRENIYRSDIDKLKLFTQMLRRNAMLKNAVITTPKPENNQ